MPCYDSRDDIEHNSSNERLDLATRVACEMAKLIKRSQLEHSLSREAQVWISDHEATDAVRRAKAVAEIAELRRRHNLTNTELRGILDQDD